MRVPSPRGPVSHWCAARLQGRAAPADPGFPSVLSDVDPLSDDDVQLSLWMLHEMHYLGFDDADPGLEWDPGLLAVCRELEGRLESELRKRTWPHVAGAGAHQDVAEAIFALCADDGAPGLASYAQRSAGREQLLELLMHRSVFQLKEADPQIWMLPRLRGRAKTALLQIEYDEYGSGRAEDVHQTLFAGTMAACGLDPTYGAYVEQAPGGTLAISNTVSMLGLHRRLLGAAAGYFAAVEATSSQPSRQMSAALERHGFGRDATHFFDEHIEADAVHEQVAARELCGSLVAGRPELRDDVLFGVAANLLIEGRFADAVLTAWDDGESSLYDVPRRLDVATTELGG